VIRLTHNPIDTQTALTQVQSTQAGAVVLFLGTAREFTLGRQTIGLMYEGYVEMAERKLAELESQARERWPVIECVLIHRLGAVELGEASVLVAVSTPHRRDAFEAAEWLMDTIKREVPIWKQEHWADGTIDWVHPGCEMGVPAPGAAGSKKEPCR
jgi:molybdopterin synthase catalytic subunit